MSVAKVIEITSGSDKSFDHAVRSGIKRASMGEGLLGSMFGKK